MKFTIDQNTKLYNTFSHRLNTPCVQNILISRNKDTFIAIETLNNSQTPVTLNVSTDTLENTFGSNWDRITVTMNEQDIVADVENYNQKDLNTIDKIINWRGLTK